MGFQGAEVNAGFGHIDALDFVPTAAHGRVISAQFTFAAFLTFADKGFVAFDFEDMAPLEFLATSTFARLGAD